MLLHGRFARGRATLSIEGAITDGRRLEPDPGAPARPAVVTVPALVRLPEPERSCALRWLKNRNVEQDWREWNLARHNAKSSLEGVAVTEVTCEGAYSGER